MVAVRIKRKAELVERRKAERYVIHVPVSIAVVKVLGMSSPKQVFETRDISSRGVFLCADPPLRPGIRLIIDIYLSFDQLRRIFGTDRRLIISLSGRVVRMEGGGMAIRFGSFYRMKMV